jgi:hypothetical protein
MTTRARPIRHVALAGVLLGCACLVAACGPATPPAVAPPSPTATAAPAVVTPLAPPSATPSPVPSAPVTAVPIAPPPVATATPSAEPSRTSLPSPTATRPAPSPTATQPAAKRIQFPTGGMWATVAGKTATAGQDRFVLKAGAGQTMSVDIWSSEGTLNLSIYGANGDVLLSDHSDSTTWAGKLPVAQDYFIAVRSVGTTVINFMLNVSIPPLPERIQFPPGGTTVTLNGALAAYGMSTYVLKAQAGQTMTVVLKTTPAGIGFLVISGADGSVLISDHAGAASWSGLLPTTQDYIIDARTGETAATYTLQVTIPPIKP